MARFPLFCIMAILPKDLLLFRIFCHNFNYGVFASRSEARGGSGIFAMMLLDIMLAHGNFAITRCYFT